MALYLGVKNKMSLNVFAKREKIWPFEYPKLDQFGLSILHSFWEVDHFNYDRDIRDFNLSLSEIEKIAIMRSMLAISVVENKVKSFWANLPQRMPKSEISNSCYIFSSNEVVHQKCYQKLLELLNLADSFEDVLNIPCMRDRVKYLNKYLEGVNSRSNREFTKSLILFTLMVENCSLFSQFLTVSSFCQYKNIMKNFYDVIRATSRDEIIHGKFGASLINIIRQENPNWFDNEMEDKVYRNIEKAYTAEMGVLDWIFENGELPFISKDEISEYLKTRFNDSLAQIGYSPFYNTDNKLLEKSNYMKVMVTSTNDFDFFDSKSTDYAKSVSFGDDIWEEI
jgi:ribonucleoside-diphosphate reductase beta chain